jgi:hypothetical protein
MDYVITFVSLLLFLSICGNIAFYFHARNSIKKPKPTQDARDLLNDLTKRGAAVVRVELVNPENMFLWKG